MKKLFAVLLAVAMLLSLGVTAFATGDITVANHPKKVAYMAYKVFDVVKNADDTLTYYVDKDSDWAADLWTEGEAPLVNSKITGLTFVPVKPDGAPYEGTGDYKYKVVKDVTFSAADFADALRTAVIAGRGPDGTESSPVWNGEYPISPDTAVTIDDLDPGYYLVLGALTNETDKDFPTTLVDGETSLGALTTVLDGETVQIQNKSDMPLDKDVDVGDGTGVNLGDNLTYTIDTVAPDLGDEASSYIFVISDTMSEGLTFTNKITINGTEYTYVPVNVEKDIYEARLDYAAGATPFTLVTDPKAALTGNQMRFGANGKTFEISFDVSSQEAGMFEGDIHIEYHAIVNENSVVEVLENKVVLSYGNDKDHLINKDDSTKNYVSQILIDKFAEGNNLQKLAGAEFKLFKLEDAVDDDTTGDVDESIDEYGNTVQVRKFYQLIVCKATDDVNDANFTPAYVFADVSFEDGTLVVPAALKALDDPDDDDQPWDSTIDNLKDGFIYKLIWVEGEANGTKVVTNSDGAAAFGYLPDGTYYLLETKAPVDYTKLLEPIQIVVDGKAATEPSMTTEQQDLILTNIANVSNTPGSTLPSTGGVGATLLTIGGIALMLAAGAFLILRRKEQE